jgi:ADP-heptose:LPS heptosyltransferase
MSQMRRAFPHLQSAVRRFSGWITSPEGTLILGETFFWLSGLRRKGRELDFPQAERVLVVRLDEIGDVVMTAPCLRELRRLKPDAWIMLVVKPAAYNLVERCPYVNEVLTYDSNTREWRRELRRHGRALRLAWRHLWHRGFDLAILPRWDTDYYHGAFLTYFSGARWRVGYSENMNEDKRRDNAGLDRLFTHILQGSGLKHEVEHNLEVIRFLGGAVQEDRLELWLSAEDEVFAEETLKARGVRRGDLLIAFGLGAGVRKRMWSLANFVKLGRQLTNGIGARIIAVGGHGEESLGQEFYRQIGDTAIDVVGKTSLRQTGALLKRCRLFVGNDAAPMHMAAAAGVPVVEISCHPQDGSPSHYNSPARFGPWGVPHLILQPESALDGCSRECIAAYAHCISSISVERVNEAVVTLLSPHGKASAAEVVVHLAS